MDSTGRGFASRMAPRSVSVPQSLDRELQDNKAGPSSMAEVAASVIRGPGRLLKSGVRMLSESQSVYPHRKQPAISELCADLDITDGSEIGAVDSVQQILRDVDFDLDQEQGPACRRALGTPDILYEIFHQLDGLNTVPHEFSQKRRKPLSLRHAQLIYGDNQQAVEIWQRALADNTTTSDYGQPMGLYNCIQVSQLWCDIAKRVLEQRIHFREGERWRQFVQSTHKNSLARKPQMLVLHKLAGAQQLEIEKVADAVGGRLEWLELYTCPGLAPTSGLLEGGNLVKIVLPGCNRVNDRTMALIAENCPRLEQLDLRACELVSDRGLKLIARYCPSLKLINVGRTRGGELITYKGVKHIARKTEVNTLGLAGCHIDDRSIWELALSRGEHLQRLSLNNCRLLTNYSVPRILGYTPKLSVLEIRGCTQITHMWPLALFKRYREQCGQQPLIEGCEVIERRMQLAVARLKQEISRQIIADCQEWVNQVDT